ncbi:MAG: hypothetical protein DRO88_00435 [Promethearchaeia archaeon]|nr:MAG: hypothetical protein DRO88_00435 [Candidatus Lokiarchaeia archaeon]
MSIDEKKLKRLRRRKRTLLVFGIIILVGSTLYIGFFIPLGKYDFSPDVWNSTSSRIYQYDIPLDPESPWPKFRANSLSNGRSQIIPTMNESLQPWTYRTGKGIFSSPVIDKDGTVYIGSADHFFYAINRSGGLKWKVQTGEIIDSSALLDDGGRVYFGSGDGKVYCVNRTNGNIIWIHRAHTEEEAAEQFDLEIHNVDWFEGNIAMLADGSILAGNDNQILYRLNRTTGDPIDYYLGNEMLWSMPAVNSKTNNLFFGTTNFALKTFFSYNIETGKKRWTSGGLGSVAASPLLTSTKEKGAVIVGGYDGILRAYTQKNGKQLWKVGTNDHIYSSPGQLSNGTIIQPSADGSIYALEPTKGKILWKFDTLEPIRSSPAIDGNDVIYVGSGEGKLFAINPDGTLRWVYQLITENRNDLNSSPGLGPDGIYIAGESGEIFFVPYDYPLTTVGLADPNSFVGTGEVLPDNGIYLIYTTPFGGLQPNPPSKIDANQPLTFTLFVRDNGDTILSEIDTKSFSVSVSNGVSVKINVAANRRFVVLTPQETWMNNSGGELKISISGNYRTHMSRIGLKFFGGRKSGVLDTEFIFHIDPRSESANPFQSPELNGGNSTVFELSRISAPNPSMLPSYNQIGFDSLHYLSGVVRTNPDSMILWTVGGKLTDNGTVVDSNLRERYPLKLIYDNGLVTFFNYDGFKINFIGSWDMPFGIYRISATYNTTTGNLNPFGAFMAVAHCDEIEFYGTGLKLMGMSEFKTGYMTVSGGLNVGYWNSGIYQMPSEVGTLSFNVIDGCVSVQLTESGLNATEHVYSILLIDSAGNPLPLYYSHNTQVISSESGMLSEVLLSFDNEETVGGSIYAYFMVDTYPVASQLLDF